ncbi:c-type cytochrome [Leptospira perdikensis]|uniref:Cytochrome c n=1 Tax=Leptospira perdikensis TaxID=2484948 RepID=A0A4R9JHY9_9LEPT|nr:cytochrome c [Leptospira perdikensis]TGL39875.1 cytochrome c [Leptospira perdikensis]
MNSKKVLVSLFALSFAFVMVACGDSKPKEETPAAVESSASADPDLVKGEELYLQNCSSCHGEKGAGDGAAAAALNPKPRNYKAPVSEWKNGNTAAGVTKTLKEGIKGSPMVAYGHLGDDNIRILAKYVEHLSKN